MDGSDKMASEPGVKWRNSAGGLKWRKRDERDGVGVNMAEKEWGRGVGVK